MHVNVRHNTVSGIYFVFQLRKVASNPFGSALVALAHVSTAPNQPLASLPPAFVKGGKCSLDICRRIDRIVGEQSGQDRAVLDAKARTCSMVW
jgi:hypothetical protein